MLLFDYSREWADFVVSQLIQRHGTRYTGIWSYSALVIGKEFENVLDKHWDEVHSILGPHLHFFALIAPPVEFVARAYKKAREQPPSEERDFLIDRYRRLLERQFPPKREQIQSKVILLRDL